MDTTVRLGLPLLMSGQAQKDVTHNEALLAIDQLLALAVGSRSVMAPPASPEPGDSYIVPPGAPAWQDEAGALMVWNGFGWVASLPPPGAIAFVIDEAATIVRAGAGWTLGWPVAALMIGGRQVLGAPPAPILAPAGGAVVDVEARNTLAALLTALAAQGLVM